MGQAPVFYKPAFFLGKFYSYLEKILPLSNVVVPFGNYKFIVPREWLEASLLNISHVYVLGDYERVPCLTCVEPGSVVLDLGAFVGFFSVKLASESRDVRIYAVEANPSACGYLGANFRLNSVKNGNILCGAVGGKSGVAQLYVAGNGVNSSLIPRYVEESSSRAYTLNVRIYTLREIFEKFSLERVSLVKMDVEGVEEEVLLSCRELVSPERVEKWIIEVHPPYSSPSRIVDLLEREYRVATFLDYDIPGQLFIYAWPRR